jgi:cobalt-zinc-cadmium efflux system membrane fusion protein
MKHLLPLLATLVAASLACRGDSPATVAGDQGDEVLVEQARIDRGEARVVTVAEQELRQAVVAAGRVAFDDQRVQHLLSPVAGRITRVLAQPGQYVARGTPLVALASPEVGTAFSDLLKAQADLGQAEADLTRQRRLVDAHAAPARDLEAAEDTHRKAQAEVSRARQKAALLRAGDVDAVTQELTLKAALPGEVMARAVSPGMEVQGAYSGGTPVELFTVGDISRVWILADLAESDLARIHPGAAAMVRVAAWPGRSFAGAVQWVADTLDPALRTGRVRLALDNADHALKPEMLAQVSIESTPRRALAVPRAALTRIEGESFVYVAEGGPAGGRQRFVRRRVRTSGDPADELAVVEEGLAAGDRLLVEGSAARDVGAGEVRISQRQAERSGIRLQIVGEELVEDSLLASARVAFDDLRVAHVLSPVTGRVARVLVQPGQRVQRGAALLTLVSPDVGSAFADAVKAEADEVAARHELTRQRDLVEAHAGARKDLEATEGAWRKAQAELARAQQKTRLLSSGSFDTVTQEYTLRSPIDGDVVARAATPGLEVQGQWSGAGAPVELFTIGALDPLWVMGDVYEMDLPHVRAGSKVEVRVPAFPARTFQGRVDWVSDVIDPATRTAKIRCAIANPGHLLRPEMAPVLDIALPSHRHLAVPREAVLRLGDDTVVFVASGKTTDGQLAFRRRKVLVGEDRPGGTVPVLEGLVPGEQVVAAGGIFLVGLL